jgi:hypothetical protein
MDSEVSSIKSALLLYRILFFISEKTPQEGKFSYSDRCLINTNPQPLIIPLNIVKLKGGNRREKADERKMFF